MLAKNVAFGVMKQGHELCEISIATFSRELVVKTPKSGSDEGVERVYGGMRWQPVNGQSFDLV